MSYDSSFAYPSVHPLPSPVSKGCVNAGAGGGEEYMVMPTMSA